MSQFDFGDLESPLSGTVLINTNLEPWRDALHSTHAGTSRPSYAAANMIWTDTSTTPWVLYMFDGSDDIAIGTVNATTNIFTPAGVTSYGGSAGGTANALTLTPTTALTAYAAGVAYEFLVTSTNTTVAPTLNVSGRGDKTIKCSVGGGKVNLPVGALQNGMIARVVYDGTDFLFLNVRAHNKSFSIATASTVNLDNANGDFVHLTGTTTITAFTLAEGVQKTCVADGAFTITDGTGNSPQGIICPGAANITTAAGDIFVIRGEGNGSTRIVSYTVAATAPGGGGGAGWENNGYASGRYYSGFNSVSDSGSIIVTANRLYGVPFVIGSDVTIDEVGLRVTSGSGNARLGIYNVENGAPTTLVADLGAVSVSTSGQKSLTGLAQDLTAGVYIFAVVFSGAPTVSACNMNGNENFVWHILGSGALDNSDATGGGVYTAHTYGALPASFGTPTYEEASSFSNPFIWFKV